MWRLTQNQRVFCLTKQTCLMGNDFDSMNSGDNACLKQLNLHNFFEHSTFFDQNSPRPFLSSAQNRVVFGYTLRVSEASTAKGLFQGRRRRRGLFVAWLRSAGHRKEAENHQKCSYQRPPRPEIRGCLLKAFFPQVFEGWTEGSFCDEKFLEESCFWCVHFGTMSEDVNQIYCSIERHCKC